jgi:hypothetical protein
MRHAAAQSSPQRTRCTAASKAHASGRGIVLRLTGRSLFRTLFLNPWQTHHASHPYPRIRRALGGHRREPVSCDPQQPAWNEPPDGR